MPSTDRRAEALHIVGLSAFAVTQPTFEVLRRHGTFFTAHGSSAADILLLVALVVMAYTAGVDRRRTIDR